MDNRQLIYHLMQRAFIEMRMAAHEGKGDKGFFKLADLFHNVPLALERSHRDESDVDALFRDIINRAKRNGSYRWLEHAAKQIDPSLDLF